MNTLSLIVLNDRRVQTDMTYDGVSVMEIHNLGQCDEDVLVKIARNEYYRDFKGDWELTLPQDSQTFTAPSITDVIAKALAYINARDNPYIYVVSPF